MIRILLLDDEPAVLDITSAYLSKQEGYHVRTVDTVKGAKLLLSQFPIDVIVADYAMPDTDGISFLKDRSPSVISIGDSLFTPYWQDYHSISVTIPKPMHLHPILPHQHPSESRTEFSLYLSIYSAGFSPYFLLPVSKLNHPPWQVLQKAQ